MAGFMDFLRENSLALGELSNGLLSGANAQQQVAGGMAGLTQAVRTKQQRNKTVQFLQNNSPELAAAVENGLMSGGDAYTFYLKQKAEAQKPARSFQQLADGSYGTYDERAGTFQKLGIAPKPRADKPATFQQLDDGTYGFADPMAGTFTTLGKAPKIGDGGAAGGEKAPSGFRWTDETRTTLEPIPGGPGQHISAEQAGRIGMVDTFLQEAPTLRQKIASGETTGVLDRAAAGNGIGKQGQVYQDLQSGVDALVRMMTGAGMNQTEAQEYAGRYLPTYKDTAETATQKFDRLVRELESQRSVVLRGRGDTRPPSSGMNVDDLVTKYGGQ